MADLRECVEFVTLHATSDDLDRIYAACRARQKALASVKAAAVKVGMVVTTEGLTPKYINGLTGEVTSITGARASVRFAHNQANRIAYTKHGPRALLTQEDPLFVMGGIPLTCLVQA